MTAMSSINQHQAAVTNSCLRRGVSVFARFFVQDLTGNRSPVIPAPITAWPLRVAASGDKENNDLVCWM